MSSKTGGVSGSGRWTINILVFLSFVGYVHNFDFNIKNQIAITTHDCYTRIAIGSRPPEGNDTVVVGMQQSVTNCEDECSRRRNCTAFSYGISPQGNASCIFSSRIPRNEELIKDPDYDVYIKGQRTPTCVHDNLASLDSGGKKLGTPAVRPQISHNQHPSYSSEHGIADYDTSNPYPTTSEDHWSSKLFPNDDFDLSPWLTKKDDNSDRFSYGQKNQQNLAQVTTYDNSHSLNSYPYQNAYEKPPEDDSKSHVKPVSSFVYFEDRGEQAGSQEVPTPYEQPGYHDYGPGAGYSTNHYETHRNTQYNQFPPRTPEYRDLSYKMKDQPRREYGTRNQPWKSQDSYFDNDPFFTKYQSNQPKQRNDVYGDPCYRRQLTGKKIAENHVRRTVETDKINNCLRACNSERSFTCRGFSYSQDRNDRRGSCEMTAMPYSGMDEYRDFEKSTNYDYFERDINCDRSSQSGWSNYPATRTQNSYYDYPAPPPSSKHFSSRPKAPYYDDYEKDMAVYRDHRPSPGRRTYGPFRTYGSYEDRYPSDRFSSDRFTPERDQGQDRNYYGHRDTKNYMRPDDEYYRRTYQQKYPSRFDGRHDLQYPGSNDLGPYEPNRRVDPDDYWRRRKIYNEYYGRDNKYFNGAGLYQRIPGDRDNFYHGTYGKEYGYGMEHKTHHNEYAHGDLGNLSKCSVRSAVGFKLGRKTMGKTYLVPNLGECEKRCLDERDHPCFTFSYRYNVDPMDPTDNCWLSDTAYLNVNFYTDLEPDRNYDIYAQIGDPKICAESKDSRRSKDDCFWRVKSGFGMPPEVIRQTVLVGHFSDCQSICISSTEFTCRSFTFRFGSKTAEGHSANCDLSDWPSLNIDDSGLVDMDGAEIYERGSFERGCEAYPLPMFIPTKDNPRPDSYYNRGDDESTCYAAQRRPCKLSPFVVTTSSHTKSELECRAKCSNIRIHDHTPCMSYSYKFDGDDSIDNCLISDVSSRDLRPGVDYIYDDNHVLYSWNELDPQCSLPGGVHGYHLSDPGNDDQTSPMFNRPVQLPFNHGGYIYYDSQDDKGPPYKLDCDTTDNKFPKYLPPGCRDRYPTPRPGDGSVYGRYTVSGIPCKRGTKCERNPVLGFWSCETEDSEPGSFEYCCEPSHQCGFSQRTEYPWCYVGLEESQWRPCNDKYTPYTHSRIPTYQPPDNGYRRSQTHRSFDERARNDHYSRHWPVVYLHSKPPPNVTDSTTLSSVRKETIYKNSVNVTSTTTTKRPEVTTVGNRTVTTNTTG